MGSKRTRGGGSSEDWGGEGGSRFFVLRDSGGYLGSTGTFTDSDPILFFFAECSHLTTDRPLHGRF